MMGVKLELSVLLAFAILGPAVFSPFELETPVWRKILKWTLMVALTLGLYRVVGHWALAVPVGMGIAGSTFHVIWCRRNGIDPLTAMPRRRYYELRGWRWRE
jgi:hypothetical protein